MPVVLRNLYVKFKLKTTSDKKLLRSYSACHGILVTIAIRNEADSYCPKEMSIPNMNSMLYKTKKLSRFQSGCHNN